MEAIAAEKGWSTMELLSGRLPHTIHHGQVSQGKAREGAKDVAMGKSPWP